jgi:hypothetical protein
MQLEASINPVPACHVDPPTVESGRVVVSWDLAADFLPERTEVWDAVLTTLRLDVFEAYCLVPSQATVGAPGPSSDFGPMGFTSSSDEDSSGRANEVNNSFSEPSSDQDEPAT